MRLVKTFILFSSSLDATGLIYFTIYSNFKLAPRQVRIYFKTLSIYIIPNIQRNLSRKYMAEKNILNTNFTLG